MNSILYGVEKSGIEIIEVGYIDALCSMMADAVGGKYLTGADMRKAFAQCITHTGKMLKGLGNPVVHDKLVAAM